MGWDGVEGAGRDRGNTKPGGCWPCYEPQVTGMTRREDGERGEEEAQMELGQSPGGPWMLPAGYLAVSIPTGSLLPCGGSLY